MNVSIGAGVCFRNVLKLNYKLLDECNLLQAEAIVEIVFKRITFFNGVTIYVDSQTALKALTEPLCQLEVGFICSEIPQDPWECIM